MSGLLTNTELKVGEQYTSVDGHTVEILRLEYHQEQPMVLYFDRFLGKSQWEAIVPFRKMLKTSPRRTPRRVP